MAGNPTTTFERLHLSRWRQFATVDISFHRTLTVLTGANASGKTTLLNILGRHFNWMTQLLGVPIAKRGGPPRWRADNRQHPAGARQIGELIYRTADLVAAPLSVPDEAQSYEVSITNQQFVPGIFVASHRSLSIYQPLSSIPLQFSASGILLDQFVGELRNRWQGSSSGRSPLSYMKEALISAAIFGEGNQSVQADPEAWAIWTGFQEVLRKVLPESLGFESLVVRRPDLIVRTSTGEFLLEAMSGGITAIVELSWQIFLRSREYESFTACIDEPENHLHPELQRAIVPGLIAAFPSIRFIVATHSPFVVTAVPESNVYVLDYDEDGVTSRLLQHVSKSTTADETLRRVLGLETTFPLWVEHQIQHVLSDMPARPSPSDLRRLQRALTEAGLAADFPAAVDSLLGDNETSG